jgi:rare lipoprotein A
MAAPQNRLRILGIWVSIIFVSTSLAAEPAQKEGRKMIGIASYYGREHQGRRMANGHRFDEHKLTAASHSLPLGSRVRVTNLKNQKSVVVTITDRMPKRNRRIIDLSAAAAHELGLIARGIGRVSVERLP